MAGIASDGPDGSEQTTAAVVSLIAAGRTVGAYRLLQRLGEGGMGEVWLAEQKHPVQRQVAFKVLKAGMDSSQVVARFDAERQALALMDHPAIATVLDGGTTPEGRLYFAMEYVRGEPITTYCERHKLTINQRLRLFVQVCHGVQHAHQKGLIHRDLKPSNVLVTIVDGQAVPKIIDFGIAKATARQLTNRTLFTELGSMIGTPEYMSPEQAEMTGLDIDTRTDVYALGVLLYELITGVLPFDSQVLRGKGLDHLRRTIRDVDPPKPSTRVRGAGVEAGSESVQAIHRGRLANLLRGDLDWITMKAIEKDRTRRYETVTGLASDVTRHLVHEPVLAGPPGTAYRLGKFIRRHRVGVVAVASATVLLVAFGLSTVAQSGRIARERDRANREAAASKQVSDFLVGLFRVSDPGEARGSTVTAREILDKGAREIQQTLSDQPDVQVRLEATMGAVYTSLGAYDAALPLLQRAVETSRRVLGDDHPDTLAAIHQLANAYWYVDQMDRAEPLYSEVYARRLRAIGPEHRDTLKVQSDLSSLFIAQSRWDIAESLTQTVLTAQTRVLGEADPDTLVTLGNLGSIYFRQERFAEAEPVTARVFELTKRAHGADHPETLVAMHNLATIYDKLGQYDRAERLYLEVIALKDRVLGTAHQQTARTRALLARMYVRQKRYADAETVALAAHSTYQTAFGADHATTRSLAADLAVLYEAWGKPVKAAEWRQRANAAPPKSR